MSDAREGVGGGYPPSTVGTFFPSNIRVSKSHFRAVKNDCLGK